MDNALRAVGANGTIELESQSHDGGVSITVRDTGPGIAPEAQARIFDPFFTTRQPGEGTGLGLHISMGVVKEHGGTLQVHSTPGAGAVFTVWLPRALPNAANQERPGVLT